MAQLREARRILRGESYCIFERGGREWAVLVAAGGEVLSDADVAEVPGAPDYLAGHLTLRAEKLPVIIIDSWMNLPLAPYGPNNQVLIVQHGDFRVGVVVDRVREIRRIDASEIGIEMPGAMLLPLLAGWWRSEDRVVSVISVERLVAEALKLRTVVPEWQAIVPTLFDVRKLHRGEDFCIFTRGGRDLAMSIASAKEVLTGETVVPIPQAPAHLVGVVNLRGDVLPLVQIDAWLELPSRPFEPEDQILVVSSGDVLVGIIVDRVRDVRQIGSEHLVPYRGDGTTMPVSGTVRLPDGEILVLDPERLVEEAVMLSEAGFRRGLVMHGVPGSDSRSIGRQGA